MTIVIITQTAYAKLVADMMSGGCNLTGRIVKIRSQELSERVARERQLARDWLLPLMSDNQPKFVTKDELRALAMRELGVLKNSFDYAWIDAIETAGRHDWYEPLPRRRRSKN